MSRVYPLQNIGSSECQMDLYIFIWRMCFHASWLKADAWMMNGMAPAALIVEEAREKGKATQSPVVSGEGQLGLWTPSKPWLLLGA